MVNLVLSLFLRKRGAMWIPLGRSVHERSRALLHALLGQRDALCRQREGPIPQREPNTGSLAEDPREGRGAVRATEKQWQHRRARQRMGGRVLFVLGSQGGPVEQSGVPADSTCRTMKWRENLGATENPGSGEAEDPTAFIVCVGGTSVCLLPAGTRRVE